ncbi:hypothetical protein MRU69_02235 [Kocuria flava]|uniref:hypothetical protein n=1 Tax=Kocuria flava TaxID=446860 RepID=UPI001FF48662|nr:hypothetical protein [Kocuria flava]MCJ8503684.1 hypothetical protein [Kocuria flava]
MPDALAPVPGRSTVVQRLVPALAPPAAVLLALWVAAGRGLAGAAGEFVPVHATALALPLGVLLGAGAVVLRRDARAHVPAGASLRACLTTAGAWAVVLAFGAVLPDRVDGRGASLLTELAGPGLLGLSAGFANTLGILSAVTAGAALVLAAVDLRRTRRIQRGEPLSEDEILDRQGL